MTVLKDTPSLINLCSPITEISEGYSNSNTGNIIRRESKDIAFTTTGDPTELVCIIDSQEDENGRYAGDTYHPVSSEIQRKLSHKTRLIKFHQCLSQRGDRFIFPQKLSKHSNSWLTSMDSALAHPHGTWLKIKSDAELQCYKHELVNLDPVKDLIWTGFDDALNEALISNLISNEYHPVLIKNSSTQQKK